MEIIFVGLAIFLGLVDKFLAHMLFKRNQLQIIAARCRFFQQKIPSRVGRNFHKLNNTNYLPSFFSTSSLASWCVQKNQS